MFCARCYCSVLFFCSSFTFNCHCWIYLFFCFSFSFFYFEKISHKHQTIYDGSGVLPAMYCTRDTIYHQWVYMSEYCVPYREHTSHNGVKCKCSAFSQVVTHFILPHIIAVAGVNIDKWMSAHSPLSLFGVACYIDLDKHAYIQLYYDFMCGKHWAKRQHIGYCQFQYACNAC